MRAIFVTADGATKWVEMDGRPHWYRVALIPRLTHYGCERPDYEQPLAFRTREYELMEQLRDHEGEYLYYREVVDGPR